MKPRTHKQRQVTVSGVVPPDAAQALERIAKSQKTSKSQLVGEAVVDWLRRRNKAA